MTDHRERGRAWRDRAAALLAPITDLLAIPAGRTPAWGDILRLDDHAVRRASECLGRADEGDDYVDSAANARRRVGLAVLGRMREQPGLDPVTAFREVIADRDAWFDDLRLLAWLDGLGRGGRGALAAEACGYAAAVAGWVPPARMGDVRISRPGEDFTWTVPGRAVQVKGRCDAMAPRRGNRPTDRRLLVVVNTLAGADVVAGHAALACTLVTAGVPQRVTVLAAATGKKSFTIDDDVLAAALERLGAAAHAGMAARFGPPAATTPGHWCRRCGRLPDCVDGTAWIASTPVRFGGLLPLAPAQPVL